MLGDWTFSIGYVLAGETAARLINVGFIFSLALMAQELALWAGASKRGSRWAVLLFLSTPLTFTEGSSLFIESVWASFVVAGILALLNCCSASGKPRDDLPVAGLLLGFAVATKAVTFTILPVLFLVLVLRYKSWLKVVGVKFMVLAFCLFFVFGVIPYLNAWWVTGNPVFPFFNHYFQSEHFSIEKNKFSAALFNQGMTWDMFYQVTFQSQRYLEVASIGASGFQWLLLFIPASVLLVLTGQRRSISLITVGILSISLTFYSTSYLRYVFPAWVVLTSVIGVILDSNRLEKFHAKYLFILTAVGAVMINTLFITAGGYYSDFNLQSLVSKESRDVYIEKRVPMRTAVRLVNVLNPTQAPVAVFGHPLTAGLTANALYPNWYNPGFMREISVTRTDEEIVNILLKRGVDFIILDSDWKGANCCGEGLEKQILVEKVSEKIAEFGPMSVRKLKSEYRFGTELLTNADFSSLKGWDLTPDAKFDPNFGVALVNVATPILQTIKITPRGRYRNTVLARCANKPTVGRIQINWMDVKGKFVSTNIKTFECTQDWTEHSMDIIAPQNAAVAIVFVVGHTLTPLEFKGNSLRQ